MNGGTVIIKRNGIANAAMAADFTDKARKCAHVLSVILPEIINAIEVTYESVGNDKAAEAIDSCIASSIQVTGAYGALFAAESSSNIALTQYFIIKNNKNALNQFKLHHVLIVSDGVTNRNMFEVIIPLIL